MENVGDKIHLFDGTAILTQEKEMFTAAELILRVC